MYVSGRKPDGVAGPPTRSILLNSIHTPRIVNERVPSYMRVQELSRLLHSQSELLLQVVDLLLKAVHVPNSAVDHSPDDIFKVGEWQYLTEVKRSVFRQQIATSGVDFPDDVRDESLGVRVSQEERCMSHLLAILLKTFRQRFCLPLVRKPVSVLARKHPEDFSVRQSQKWH
jgi:hypothetical protein